MGFRLGLAGLLVVGPWLSLAEGQFLILARRDGFSERHGGLRRRASREREASRLRCEE
jgi:hypothetical protein